MKYALLLLALVGCASQPPAPVYNLRPDPLPVVQNTMQELVMDKQIQPMGRNEVIDGVKQCESAGLRAVPIYAIFKNKNVKVPIHFVIFRFRPRPFNGNFIPNNVGNKFALIAII